MPTAIGTYWVYSGTDREANESGEIETTSTKRKLTVVDSISVLGVFGVVVEETNLMNTDVDSAQKKYVAQLVFDNKRFYQRVLIRPAETWGMLKHEISLGHRPSELTECADALGLFMKVPSTPGTMWDDVGKNLTRDLNGQLGTWYCWCVEKIAPLRSGTDIAHFRLPAAAAEYTIAYRSNPALELRTFVPGIGFTGSHYKQRGPVSDIDETLVEFHPAIR